jgi:AmmeMemoRadiSam system protein A
MSLNSGNSENGTEPSTLSAQDRDILLHVARAAIEYGLQYRRPQAVSALDYSPALRAQRATFVTLLMRGALRGCVGTLDAVRELVADVAHHAHAAAFSDPRFPPLSHYELEEISIHLSILSPPEDLFFDSEQALLSQLRCGIDGLILEDLGRRATFLPSVWESLPEPREFLCQLKRKAGLPADYWSATLKARRYRTEAVP